MATKEAAKKKSISSVISELTQVQDGLEILHYLSMRLSYPRLKAVNKL